MTINCQVHFSFVSKCERTPKGTSEDGHPEVNVYRRKEAALFQSVKGYTKSTFTKTYMVQKNLESVVNYG